MGMQENNMSKVPSLEATEEELKLEFQEIMKKRAEYQKELEQETISFQKEEAEHRRRRFSRVVKAAVVVLVAGTCFIAFAARSEATRMWWISSVERIIGKETGHVVDNDDNRMINDMTVQQAIAEIEDKTGIPMPEFYYQPEELIFDGFDYNEKALRGHLQYIYDDYAVHLNAFSNDTNSSYSWNYDGNINFEEKIETSYATVKVMEIKAEDDVEINMVAEWTYKNHQYQFVGKMDADEFILIIKNIFY